MRRILRTIAFHLGINCLQGTGIVALGAYSEFRLEVGQLRTLIIEDNPDDIRIAARVARTAGFEDVEAFTTLDSAIERIEQGLRGEKALPDAIIVDLNLGQESGYEVLRHWRATWSKSAMRMVVWSALGDHNQELCALFHADAFVSKWRGEAALHEALVRVNGASPVDI
jgi:CheY-like chemotaxis protein